MKKLILISSVVFSVFSMTSCNKTAVAPADVTSTSTDANARSAADSAKNSVAVTALPAAITSYVTANYAGATISKAHTTKDGGYHVLITKADATKAKLEFTAAGVFVKESTGKDGGKGGPKGAGKGGNKGGTKTTNVAVTQANLLPAISTYLNANYAGYTFGNAYSEADSAGKIVNYDVNITVGTVKYHVVFDAAGAFVSVKTKK